MVFCADLAQALPLLLPSTNMRCGAVCQTPVNAAAALVKRLAHLVAAPLRQSAPLPLVPVGLAWEAAQCGTTNIKHVLYKTCLMFTCQDEDARLDQDSVNSGEATLLRGVCTNARGEQPDWVSGSVPTFIAGGKLGLVLSVNQPHQHR